VREPGKKFAATVACVAALAGALAAGALADSQAVTPNVDCCTFSAPTFTVDAGTVAQFVNLTDTTHDVTASDKGPDGGKLFNSGQVKQGTVPIDGTQYLAAGDYHFICAIHGAGMSATLRVNPGSPQARPSVAVTIPAQSLSSVAKQGKLKVSVKGKVAATGVTLVAKKGKTTLGTLKKLNAPAGSTKTQKITLTAAGKKALKNVKKATVSVQGTVPFGKPAKASRTLK